MAQPLRMQPLCMARGCTRDAVLDLDTWPLCRHDAFVRDEVRRRYTRQEDRGTHARKEALGGRP